MIFENDIQVLRETSTTKVVQIKFKDGYLYEVFEKKGDEKGIIYMQTRNRNAALKRFYYIKSLERGKNNEKY